VAQGCCAGVPSKHSDKRQINQSCDDAMPLHFRAICRLQLCVSDSKRDAETRSTGGGNSGGGGRGEPAGEVKDKDAGGGGVGGSLSWRKKRRPRAPPPSTAAPPTQRVKVPAPRAGKRTQRATVTNLKPSTWWVRTDGGQVLYVGVWWVLSCS
jgi:hypothetical protein